MATPWHSNTFRITGFPSQNTSIVELLYICRYPDHAVEQTVDFTVISDAMKVIMWRDCNASGAASHTDSLHARRVTVYLNS